MKKSDFHFHFHFLDGKTTSTLMSFFSAEMSKIVGTAVFGVAARICFSQFQRVLLMESSSISSSSSAKAGSWFHVLYLGLVLGILYFLHHLFPFQIQTHHQILKIKLKRNPPLPLRFRCHDAHASFKILQVADMHYGNHGGTTRCRDVLSSDFPYCSDLNSSLFLRSLILSERPDFIAFTGDNIFGSTSTDAAESLFGAFAPAMESRIPWAAVLGNHDQESTMNREELMFFISLMDYSLSQINPHQHQHGLDGFGNFNLSVFGPPGSHLANTTLLNLLFLDTGDRETVDGIHTYGWIKESQLRWISCLAQKFKGQKGNTLMPPTPPALAFFHIPIPEVRQLYNKKVVGQFQEAVACSSINSGVLQTFVSMGDVKAVFMGHDHNNDFCGNLDGIWFCYGGGFGYHGYGKVGWPRRARIVLAELGTGERDWMGVKRIKTWKRLDDDKLSKIDEQVLWEWESLSR